MLNFPLKVNYSAVGGGKHKALDSDTRSPIVGPGRAGHRIDLPIREIKQLFESFKGIRISNHLAYQIQDGLVRGEGELVGPSLDVAGVKTRFAINGLPSLASLRRVILYRSLLKSRAKSGRIDLDFTAHFLRLTQKGALTPIDQLKRRLFLEGITISPDGRDIRVRGGLNFEELSFDFDPPAEGLDIADFGRRLLLSVYEFHDCSVGTTAAFFHTNEQLMNGILKRAGVVFETPDMLQHFQLSPELERQFGPVVRDQLVERLMVPMTEILRTAKARARKKKLANRRFLDEMEERVKNHIHLVMVPEFGPTVLNDENAAALHACAWHFLQWEIGQLPVEDILNLEVVSPYEMMFSRILKRLGLTDTGCPVFFNKDYTPLGDKPYAPIVVTHETLLLLLRYFKTADLLESSFHETMVASDSTDTDPTRSLLEIELKHVQRNPVVMRDEDLRHRLETALLKLANLQELYGALSVEVKQVLTAMQELTEISNLHFFGIAAEDFPKVLAILRQGSDDVQPFVRQDPTSFRSIDQLTVAYRQTISAFQSTVEKVAALAREDRRWFNTWASLSELYRELYSVKGLDPPTSRRKRTTPIKHEGFPMLRFGPDLAEIQPDRLLRATFVFPSESFHKLNLVAPHLRTFFILDEPDNHMSQYHLAAWAFRIHWKRRRLGHGQKRVADDYIRSLRFMRAFIYRRDREDRPYLILCNTDSDFFGLAKLASGQTLLEQTKFIAKEALGLDDEHIIEVAQADEPANEHDRLRYFLELIVARHP